MMRLLTNRWVHMVVLVGLLGGAILVRMNDYAWARSLSYLAFDAYNKWNPRVPTDAVTMIDIDEASLARPELGQWPWSRDILARLVAQLHDMGARAIVFDMVFAEADRTSPGTMLDRLPADQRTAEITAAFSTMPDNDDLFARAIADAGNVVMGFIWTTSADSTRQAPHLSKPILLSKAARPVDGTVPTMRAVANNLPALSKAAAGNGSFGVTPEVDGIIRRVPLLFRYEQPQGGATLYPSLAVEALRVAQSAKTIVKLRTLAQDEGGIFDSPLRMSIGKYEVPLDWDGHFIGYFSPSRPKQYIPAWRILANEVNVERVAGKIVFIGTSAAGLRDIRSTPLDLYIPGVELHMNVVEQIMTGEFLTRPEIVEGVELLALIALGCGIIVLAPFIGAVYMALFTATLIGGTAFLSWYSFVAYGLLIDPVYPSICLLTIFVVATLLSYVRTEYERSRVRQAFGLYISPDFMEELTKDPDKLKLGGETRELTVMFTDIRGFTTISESMSPEALTQLMNSFLTPMSDLVMETRGTIDKYMGDAMMAFWNAPLDDADHARHACTAALRMFSALAPVNERLQAEALATGQKPVVLNAGIGINTGPASVGNMGSRQRFAYSALGDTVNLASRLEGQTKSYGVNILISDATRRFIPDFATVELDLIRVKGKTEPVRIFTIAGDEILADTTSFREWTARHDAMMAAYRAGHFVDSAKILAECVTLSTEEMRGFYAMFAARLAELSAAPVAAGWDGVYTATSK